MATNAVTPLRQRMIEDMNARKLCAGTQRGHIRSCRRFAAFLSSTSEVAVCCSRASVSSRVRALTCCCRSARVELAGGAAVGALLRLGFLVLPRCVFAGLRVIVRRRVTEPSRWPTTIRYQ